MIEVVNFAKSFAGRMIHQNVSFKVSQGECLGLIGGSGAGKSVILRSLIGLNRADSGRIRIENEDITELKEESLKEIRKKVAYVFQGGALFDSMSVYDNLAYPLREHTQLSEVEIKTRIQETLKEFGLSEAEGLLPASLSGGMQKRVGLARAIILHPKVVLYDEPTAGLDPYNTNRIEEMILMLKNKGVTSILVTHDMPVALAVCDRLILLQKGLIRSELTPKEFQSAPDTHPLKRFIHGEES